MRATHPPLAIRWAQYEDAALKMAEVAPLAREAKAAPFKRSVATHGVMTGMTELWL